MTVLSLVTCDMLDCTHYQWCNYWVGCVPLTLWQLADVPLSFFHSWMWLFHQINPKQPQVSVHNARNFNAY